GSSLSRVPDGGDTNDNLADFSVTEPSPGAFNVPRRDAALRRARETNIRDVLPAPATEVVRLCVVNRGVNPIARRSVVVELRDSTQAGSWDVGHFTNDFDIALDDSVEVTFRVDLTLGYHWIRALMTYPSDEREGNNSVQLFRRVGAPPVIISEVMSHPLSRCPEYVELLNTSGDPYDLAGHWIRDAAHSPVRIVSESAVIRSRGLAVLTPDAEGLLDYFPGLRPDVVIQPEGIWPTLNHSGSGVEADSVILLDSLLLAVDRVAYPPQPSSTRGRSVERVDLYPVIGHHTWVLSSASRGGSPGEETTGAILQRPLGRSMIVTPKSFDPWQTETLCVTVPEQPVASRVVVSVYDIEGRRVSELGSTMQLPSVFAWDGKNAEGDTVRPGLYIVACEFFLLETNDRRVEKVVVGCGRKTER
ncbi:MAG: lamin tail domain-containing protein, partial [Candidatus Latescibacterota bacterium]